MDDHFAALDRQQLAIVAETATSISAADNLDSVLHAVIIGMARLTGADSGGVRLPTALSTCP